MGRAQRRAISADPHKGRVAERDLAAIAAEQIEADGDDDVDHREFDEVEVIARCDQRQRGKQHNTGKYQQNTRAHRYTLLTLEAPARPCGRSSNSRTSTPKGTRFLNVAPKNAPSMVESAQAAENTEPMRIPISLAAIGSSAVARMALPNLL